MTEVRNFSLPASEFVTPLEVVTPKGTARHAALVPSSWKDRRSVPGGLGVCGRAQRASVLLSVEWLRSHGGLNGGADCRACWRAVAMAEGVTS